MAPAARKRGASWGGALPHPTPLRGATFSRGREKEGTPFDSIYNSMNSDDQKSMGAPFSHLWENAARRSRVG
jgi:hypothetical protein